MLATANGALRLLHLGMLRVGTKQALRRVSRNGELKGAVVSTSQSAHVVQATGNFVCLGRPGLTTEAYLQISPALSRRSYGRPWCLLFVTVADFFVRMPLAALWCE